MNAIPATKANLAKHLVTAIVWWLAFLFTTYLVTIKVLKGEPVIFFHFLVPYALLIAVVRSTYRYIYHRSLRNGRVSQSRLPSDSSLDQEAMSDTSESNQVFDQFLLQLDAALEDDHMADNARAASLVALGLCTLAHDAFDDEQSKAIEAARRWLLDGDEGERARWRRIIVDKVSMEAPLPATDRIILFALNPPPGLDGYNAECLAYLGEDIGLNPTQIAGVFSEHVPGFHPTLQSQG